MCSYPTIDLAATGRNIVRLRQARGLTVRDLQAYFGFDDPQAIYRWQWGKSLPSVDNLYALSVLLGVSMNEILVPAEQQAEACCSSIFRIAHCGAAVIEPLVQPLFLPFRRVTLQNRQTGCNPRFAVLH